MDPGRAAEVLDQPPGDCAHDVRCLIAAKYAGAPASQKLALALFDEFGDVAGVEVEQDMDGGFRGNIHLVPELPVSKEGRKHLGWVLGAQRELARVTGALAGKARAALAYRHTGLAWRFMRSVKRRTPSAYAISWEVGYNLAGSLLTSQERVTQTLVHEIFHLNDQEHGGWSRRVLGSLVDGVAARCGTAIKCLTPYAPMPTRVRGGTYYAFQPDNGDMAMEYAAELATRYFLEQRAALTGKPLPPWKCLTAENGQAWAALASEFFAGVDLTASCT